MTLFLPNLSKIGFEPSVSSVFFVLFVLPSILGISPSGLVRIEFAGSSMSLCRSLDAPLDSDSRASKNRLVAIVADCAAIFAARNI